MFWKPYTVVERLLRISNRYGGESIWEASVILAKTVGLGSLPSSDEVAPMVDTVPTRIPSCSAGRAGFSYLSLAEHSLKSLGDGLSALGPDSVALLLQHFVDREGRSWTVQQSTPYLCARAAVPCFVLTDIRVGLGALGGHVVSVRIHGEEAAKMVVRILSGEPIASIPVLEDSPNAYLFDWAALRRFGILEDMCARIHSMAMVHEQLYSSRSLSSIDLSAYLRGLVESLRCNYDPKGRVKLDLDLGAEPIPALIDTAIPCGLIVNELVCNAFKYAFSNGRSGELRLSAKREGEDRVLLEVRDDGPGLPPGFDPRTSGRLGFQIIITIAEHQLNGSVEFPEGPGFGCRIALQNDLYNERV